MGRNGKKQEEPESNGKKQNANNESQKNGKMLTKSQDPGDFLKILIRETTESFDVCTNTKQIPKTVADTVKIKTEIPIVLTFV